MKSCLLPLFFALIIGHQLACSSQAKMYRCPPCGFDCHHEHFNAPGKCPVCAMTLIEVVDPQFDGYQMQKVTITNGTIQLHAAYYTPVETDIRGALILAHGSAPTEFRDLSYYIQLGTRLNMAVLAYDKRGVGQSSGKYQFFNVAESEVWFELLASDILACLDWLEERPEIINKKIGLLGGSQAGWIMPLAASKTDQIDFMIIGEGAAVSAGEEHYFSQLSGDGSGEGVSIAEADQALSNFAGEKGFDPAPILPELKVHTLWFFGTEDPVIPVDASIRALQAMNNPYFKIQLLENGNHDFINVATKEPYDLSAFIKPWLQQTGMIE